MTYKVSEEGNISTVFLNGEIDMDVTEKAKEVILPLVESGKEVHLNLKDVSYMDSSGISVLIESKKLSEQKKTKFAYGPNARVIKSLNDKPIKFSDDVSGVVKVLQIDTVAVYDLLKNGNVNFKESNTRLDSCKLYTIQNDDFKLKVVFMPASKYPSVLVSNSLIRF